MIRQYDTVWDPKEDGPHLILKCKEVYNTYNIAVCSYSKWKKNGTTIHLNSLAANDAKFNS